MGLWEDVLTYNEIIFGYIQLLSMVLKIDVPWPEAWKINLEWLNIFRLDLNIQIPNIPKLDFRYSIILTAYNCHFSFCAFFHYFAIVAVILPLGFTFFFLIMFKRKRVVVWYFALIAGICLLIAGTLAMLLPYINSLVSINAQYVLIVGGILVFVCLVMFLISTKTKAGKKAFPQPDASQRQKMAEWIDEDEEDMTTLVEMPPPALYRNIGIFLIWVACALLGVVALGLLTVSRVVQTPLQSLGTGLGYALLIVAGIVFIYWVLLNTKKGRSFIDGFRATYRAIFLRLTFFLLALYYIPVTSTLASAWVCINKSCPTGYYFEHASLLPTVEIKEYTSDISLCTKCTFLSPCSFSSTLCPGETDNRLAANLYLSCSQIGPFVWPVAGVMMLGFTIGVPALFYMLITKHAKFMKQIPSLADKKRTQPKVATATATPGAGASVEHEMRPVARPAFGGVQTAHLQENEGGVGEGGGGEGEIEKVNINAGDVEGGEPEVSAWEQFRRKREEAKMEKKRLDDEWEVKVAISKNSSKSLYMAFERRMRFYKLIIILHKLAVVVVTVILIQYSYVLSIIMGVIHLGFTIVSVKTQPYISFAQDLLATATSLCLFLSTLYAILLGYGVAIPPIASFILLLANLVLPVLFWVIGFLVNLRKSSKRDEVLKRKDANVTAQVKIIDKNINNYTLQTMTNFFLLLGLLAFLSFIALFLAVLYDNTSSNTVGVDYIPSSNALSDAEFEKEMKKFQFANYAHWQDFVSNCCCQQGATSSATDSREVQVEQWKCKNSLTKLRLRQERDSTLQVLSGIPLRGMCAQQFASGVCDPTYVKYSAPLEETHIQAGLYYKGIISPPICLAANFTGPSALNSATSSVRKFLW